MRIIERVKMDTTLESSLHITQIMIFTFASELLLSTIVFLLGFSIIWPFFLVSFAIAVVLCKIITRNDIVWFEVISSLLLFLILSWVSGTVFDTSVDGNTFHKLAVGLLKNHWNPLRSLPSLAPVGGAGLKGVGNTLWVETYCKATWVYGASIYSLTGNIETGKSYTMIAVVCAFLSVFYYMRKKNHPLFQSITMACVTAFNPIAVQQMFTFYNDGFLHTILILLIVSLLMMEDPETFDHKASAGLTAASMIVCGNIKFTGLLYGGLFCIAYFLYDAFRTIGKDKSQISSIFKEGVFYLCLVFVVVVWAGGPTYITNIIRHGSLTYPLTGEGKVDIITANSPFPVSNLKTTFLSLFSRVDNFTLDSGQSPVLKVPFSFNQKELEMTMIADARISGFGVFFGGLLIVSLVVIPIWLLCCKNHAVKILVCLNLAVCLGLMFGIKESWWARYSPYIYVIMLIAVYVLLDSKSRVTAVIAVVFAVFIMTNNCLPFIWLGKNIQTAKAVDAYYCDLKNYGLIEVCTEPFEGVFFNLIDYDIDYRINNYLMNEENLNTTNYMRTIWRQIESS